MIKTLIFFLLLISTFVRAQDVFEFCRSGDLKGLKALVEKEPNCVNAKNEYGFSPLIIASYRGQVSIVKFLLSHGANINFESEEGPALMGTCYSGNYKLSKLLIKAGADVNYQHKSGNTPLHYAVTSGNGQLIKYLISCGADVKKINGEGKSARDIAEDSGNIRAIQLLEK